MLPLVSIIIPTHNRREAVLRALTAVANQTFPLDQLELVVVADGCVDDTVTVLRQQTFPFRLTVLEQPGLGPAAARNAGAAQANGSLLIFFDDDIEVVPGFVEAHVAAHQQCANRVVMGPLPAAPLPQIGYYEQGLQQWWRDKYSQMGQPGYRFGYDDLFSGNFSVGAALFAQVGGFEEALRCHEDYELGLRLIAAGATFAFAADASGTHHDQTDIRRTMQRRRAEGEADHFLLQHYPELLKDLPIAQPEWTPLQRVMRLSAFRLPRFGDAMARLQQVCLIPLEKLWLRRLWWLLFAHLHDYWYWRGVATVEPNPAAIAQLFALEERPSTTPNFTLDLAQGIDSAATELDKQRPTSLRLVYDERWLADLPAVPGKERLHGGHLRRLLAENLPHQLLLAHANFPGALLPVPNDALLSFSDAVCPHDDCQPLPLLQSKKVSQLDVAQPLPAQDIQGYNGLHLLVRAVGKPVGTVTLTNLRGPVVSAAQLAQAVQAQLAELLLASTLPRSQPTAALPPISVVVCTRDRTAHLATCLETLQQLDYPQFEIIVVDNAPTTAETAQLVTSSRARYVREDRPGLNWARNRGLVAATHDLVAFTDDDARPDSGWLRAVAAAFVDETVTAVTGPVLPVSLDTPAQNLFEFGYGGMSHGFERREFRRKTGVAGDKLLWASGYGVGANMALRRSHLATIGEFDVALDVGTPSGGGGDVEMFHRLVARGGTLVYEPGALVWHQHRSGEADLLKLVQNNGRSFGCYLLTCARNQTVSRRAIFWFALRHWLWGWIGQRLLRPNGFPRRLIWQELKHALASPLAYWQTQNKARAVAGTMPSQALIAGAVSSYFFQESQLKETEDDGIST